MNKFFSILMLSAAITIIGCGDGQDEELSDGMGGYGSGGGSSRTNASDGTAMSVEELAVGTWSGAMRCTNGTDTVVFSYARYLCPNGNLRGVTILDVEGGYKFEYYDEGSYTVRESVSEIRSSYRSTVVRPSEIAGESDWFTDIFRYEMADDTMTATEGCPVTLERIGDATNSDCN